MKALPSDSYTAKIPEAITVVVSLDTMERSTCSASLPFSQPQSMPTLNGDTPETASSLITLLCDDTLLRILSFADLPSLVYFTRGTSNSLRRHFLPEKGCNNFHPDIWHEAFANLNLAPVNNSNAHHVAGGPSLLIDGEFVQVADYFNLIRQRLSLWSTLSGTSRRKKRISTKQCFSLPSRLFHFVPLVPPDMMHYPPVAASGGNSNNEIIFSFLEDGSDEEDGGEDHDFDDIDMDPHDETDENTNGMGMHHHGTMEFDPPPVEFACDSFSLTSVGTGGEFVLLNPFSGSIEVYNSILDNAISSDETMLEQAMMDASEGIITKHGNGHNRGTRRSGGDRGMFHEEDDHPDENSEVIAGEAIHNRLHLNQKMYDTPPKQVLFSIDDYFDLDLNEYFGQDTPFASHGGRHERRGNVTVDWVGVDAHAALSKDYKSISGNIIGAARILTMESDHGEDELACTEIFAWSNFDKNEEFDGSDGGATYSSKYVCRAAGSFYFLDICANYKKLYAAFQTGCCPFNEVGSEPVNNLIQGNRNELRLMDIDEESMVNEDGAPIRMSRTIFCLPLIEYEYSAPCPEEAIGSYFPTPDARIVAQYPVSSFSVDPSGKFLLVGTIYGTVEVWCTGIDPHSSTMTPARLQMLSVRESFMKRHRSMTMDESHTTSYGVNADTSASSPDDCHDKPINVEFDDNITAQDDLALLENDTAEEEEFPHRHPTSRISQIYLPRHLPVQYSGFVTKQRSSEFGTTILLWQMMKLGSDPAQYSINERFHITAMINLPLSVQCHPEVHFDGRRLIVFGKDHIGLIFLVYHVLGTRFDQHEFDVKAPAGTARGKRGGNNREESGGVLHTTSERRLKFVNRIRHVGLGGLEYYDSMLLSSNERFLVVNTKAGNLVGCDGARNASEGLLVIDLQDYGCY